jgi:hypothetical protein
MMNAGIREICERPHRNMWNIGKAIIWEKAEIKSQKRRKMTKKSS